MNADSINVITTTQRKIRLAECCRSLYHTITYNVNKVYKKNYTVYECAKNSGGVLQKSWTCLFDGFSFLAMVCL